MISRIIDFTKTGIWRIRRKNLPPAKGHLLLVETHNGKPIVPLDVLEKHFPGASSGLQNIDGTVKVGKTTVIFFDFSKPLIRLHLQQRKNPGLAQ